MANRSQSRLSRIRALLSGLNLQFVIYFLLFSYVPLVIFSVFGYFLNKSIIRDAHQQHLEQITNLAAQNLMTYQNYLHSELRDITMFHYHTGSDPEKIVRVFPDLTAKFNKIYMVEKGRLLAEFGSANVNFEPSATPDHSIIDNRYLLISFLYDENRACYGLVDTQKIAQILPDVLGEDRVEIHIGEHRLSILTGWDSAKQKQLFATSRIGNDGFLVIERSTAHYYAELDRFLIQIILANLFIGVLILILAMVFSMRITNPIRILLEAAQKIGRGDLSQPVAVDSKNEIKNLADEFEVMRKKLKQSYSGLESIIEERTAALREAQFQISHQEKMASLGLLAAGVAHEIGNPLTSISSMAQVIKRKVKDQQFIEYLNTILKNIERISKIVRELVDFARPSNYQADFTDINEILKNAVNIVKYDKRAKRIDIKMELDPDLPPLFLVADQLLQVCLNILINAVDALKDEQDKIFVRSRRNSEYLIIEIEDTGSGIKEEHLSKIFEPFFSTKVVGKGTGLGLSVSYGIIKNWDGRISVNSKVDKGSLFTISLPKELAEKIG